MAKARSTSAQQAQTAVKFHPLTHAIRAALRHPDTRQVRGPGISARAGLGIIAALVSPGLAWSPPAAANPQGGQVVAGSAAIVQSSPSRLDVVQRTDRAIIDWRGFSIDPGEHTHFQQPDASAVALNRVRGNDPSNIQGDLTANGRIFLVNRNGVVFGKNARVDVGGLVATTADIRNQDFMEGRYVFDQPSGKDRKSVV